MLKITQNPKGTTLHLALEGDIDEDIQLSEIQAGGAAIVEIDFHGVKLINSSGIREWINWLAKLPQGARIAYVRCPAKVVEQINMVDGFLPRNGSVDSYYVPYYCEACDEELQVLFQRNVDPREQEPPKCPTCKGDTELDVVEAKYFKFLGQKK